jgi:GH24 family phage-related lysozyme (muramidase)
MYNDVAGHCTIGYGYLIHKGRCTGKAASEKPFLKGITQPQAEALLMQKVRRFEDVVKKAVKVILNQNQFDALVSFVYNLGPGAFQSSTLLKKLNEGKYDVVPAEIRKWVKAGGKTIKGLEIRRNEEANLFATPLDTPASAG